MNQGIDTGNIIIQRKVVYQEDDTLKTSFYKSRTSIINMLFENWLNIKNQVLKPYAQKGTGSYHSEKEFQAIWPKLEKGWNTSIFELKKIKKIIE